MKNIHFLILSIGFLFSCGNETEKSSFVQEIELAHQKKNFLSRQAIAFDFQLIFREKERMNARVTLTTNSTKARIELSNGEEILVDGDKAYCSPGLADNPSVRFDAYTWSYFFLFPYKLSDPGTHWAPYEPGPTEKEFEAQKLTFGENIGDAPEDWYKVFVDPKSHYIQHAAYIVTMNKSLEEAEADPHAIQYLDYEMLSGVPIARTWKFWGWQHDKGLTKQLGYANISNVKFIEKGIEDSFEVPEGYIQR